jgi:glucose/mannose-6-phosphate isomerase
MHKLDNVQWIRQIDRSNMLDKIHRMPEYLTEAVDGFKKTEGIDRLMDVDNVALVGMGTSAIAGEIALDWLSDNLRIPTVLIRDSGLPSFSNERTMILTISYSGDTQETLEGLMNALRQQCRVVTISSGGNMKRISERKRVPHIDIKAGLEPRTAFPFLFVASTLILALLNNKEDADKEIRRASNDLNSLRNRIGWNVFCAENPAKQLAISLVDSIPVAYAFWKNGGLARRFKNQLNENCKMPVMLSILPEACHNELEAWSGVGNYTSKFSHVFLRACENDEETIRIQETQRSLKEMGAMNIQEVKGEGNTRVSQLLSVIYFVDYVSFYLAVLKGIDPAPWEKIQEFKRRILLKTHFKEKLE